MPAIYYHPEAYTTSGPKLMGRNAAGESFLRGFLSHSTSVEFWAQVQRPEHARHFASSVASFGRSEPVRTVDKSSLGALAQAGVVYYPGPGIGEHAFHRAAFGHSAWSLCGITHTTSSAGAMDALADLITSPVQPWDAVICTSIAVKDNVTRLLQAQVDYLKDRLGITKIVLPQLPVIPLGIHTSDFAFTYPQKAAARAALGVTADTLVVLFMGRLSFHAKAHPLAMYQALEAAARASGKSVVLVECGWHANEFIEKAYADAARLACPSVRVLTLDGRKPEDRQTAWAGADVFCSLSDNIQETFGIVPIEAMAAGLPVVVSDWDGYKDTVRDGVDGFRIPTLMPQAGLGGDLALRHALEIDTYDMYCGHTCSLVAVDVQATAAALTRLFNSPELRRQMGEAGRKRAVEVYDWRPIIGQYEALWAKQTELRLAAKAEADKNGVKPLVHPWPARMDPFHAFASYPTQSLTPQTRLALVDASVDIAVARAIQYKSLNMVEFAKLILPSDQEIEIILLAAVGQNKIAEELIRNIPVERTPYVMRSLSSLVKLGVLKNMSLPSDQLEVMSKQLEPLSQEQETDLIQSKRGTHQHKKISAKKENKGSRKYYSKGFQKVNTPSHTEVNDLLARYQGRQYEAAEILATSMTKKYPNNQFGWKVLGAVLGASGNHNSSITAHEKAISLMPNDPEAHSNLGVTLKALGRLSEAEACFRQAIKIKLENPEAHYNLGNVLRDLGRNDEALEAISNSIRIKPSANAKANFVNISKYVCPKFWDVALSELVISALLEPWSRPLYVMVIACRMLKLEPGFRLVLSQANGYLNQNVDQSFLKSFVEAQLESSALLQAMLSSSHINDNELEQLFTRLRHNFLLKVASSITNNFKCNNIPEFYCYLAQQCFINEYVYFETSEEIDIIQKLLSKLQSALEHEEEISSYLLVIAACYVPLHTVLWAERLLQMNWPSHVSDVLRQQIQEPLDEIKLRTFIPILTSIDNKVSLKVQQMYEENPYPRWVRLPKVNSERTLNAHINEILCCEIFRPLADDRNPQILVAGCGTGQHPIGTAQLIKGASVLAIDLSMASLSYAKRKSDQLGINNLDFAQADLLKLKSLGLTFDLIESAGVLHHLENPYEGLDVLQSLLKPNGLMKLGFYSDLARKGIVKIRDMISKEGISSSAQSIRSYRKHLLNLNKSEDFGISINNSDFFTTSACRDLLFHVQEHRMTLPKLSKYFLLNDFSFLGFEIESSLRSLYIKRFPNDPSATNLSNWHIYEEENPYTFIGMYQFWIQKNTNHYNIY